MSFGIGEAELRDQLLRENSEYRRLAAAHQSCKDQLESFLKDFLNRQFASPLITIVDDGTINKSLGSAPFDGEGVATGRTRLCH